MPEVKLNTHHTKRGYAADFNYRSSEIRRLLEEGVALSKIAKMLSIKYSLAKTTSTTL